MGQNTANNDTRVPLISLFTFITAQDSISTLEILLIGGVCQWVHRYLKGLLAAFCFVFRIWPNL